MKTLGDLLEGFNTALVSLAPHKVELEHGAQEEAAGPLPLGARVVVAALCRLVVVTIVAVDVVGVVLVVAGVEGGDAAGAEEVLVDLLEGDEGVLGVEEVGGHAHGDGVVGAQLVVPVLLLAAVDVLVDATTVDDRRVDVVVGELGVVGGDVEAVLEAVLDLLRPGIVGDHLALVGGNAIVLELAGGLELTNPLQGAVQ